MDAEYNDEISVQISMKTREKGFCRMKCTMAEREPNVDGKGYGINYFDYAEKRRTITSTHCSALLTKSQNKILVLDLSKARADVKFDKFHNKTVLSRLEIVFENVTEDINDHLSNQESRVQRRPRLAVSNCSINRITSKSIVFKKLLEVAKQCLFRKSENITSHAFDYSENLSRKRLCKLCNTWITLDLKAIMKFLKSLKVELVATDRKNMVAVVYECCQHLQAGRNERCNKIKAGGYTTRTST
ncbi:hypothetical protein GQX74_004250 [Glossina fuscipes]|nr:hypothetical protein GQX74_004250 [Glossina fuscipes]